VRKIGRFQRNRNRFCTFLQYLLPSRQRRFDLDQAAMISIKWQSVDLQPNAA